MQPQEEFRIIIFISHSSISFEYYQRDGAGKVVPIPHASCRWPEPLAFYSSSMETMLGRAALSAFNSGTPNAFYGYFEHLPKNLSYKRGGLMKQFGKILLDAAEEVFASFFSEQLLNNRGDLSANRATMPVMIVCEEDVKDNERAHLAKLFRDAGYGKAKVVSYKTFIERYARQTLKKNYDSDYVLEVWTEGSDLTMALIDLRNEQDSPTHIFEGLGRDPRLDFVKDKIWNDMLGFNGFLERDKEEDAIERAALEFLNGTENVVDGRIIASDGAGYNYWLNRFEINFAEAEESTLIRRGVSNFLNQNGLKERDRILLVLRGSTAHNNYFESNLTNGFDKILPSSKTIREQVKDLIIAEPIPVVQTEPKEPEKEPGRSGGEETAGTGSRTLPPPSTDDGKIKRKKREWRAISADADGKCRLGMHAQAIASVEAFLNALKKEGMDGLEQEVMAKLAELKKVAAPKPVPQTPRKEEVKKPVNIPKPPVAPEKPKVSTPVNPIPKAKVPPVKGVRSVPPPIPPSVSVDKKVSEGERLCKEGRLKEAREWFRAQGDSAKAKIIADLLREERSVNARRSTLEDYKKTRNVEQAKKIVKELEDYIKKCMEIGYVPVSIKKLRDDYKKIK